MPFKSWESLGIKEKVVTDWAKDLNPKTAKNYVYYLKKYLDWVKEQGYFSSAKEMLDDYDSLDKPRDHYKHLDMLMNFIKTRETGSRDKEINYMAVRNFYNYYRLDLPKPSTNERNKMVEPSKNDYRRATEIPPTMTTEELKKVLDNMGEPHKTALLVCFQAPFGRAEFEVFNTQAWKQIKDKLDEPEPIPVNLYRKKTSKGGVYRYYTYLGQDAKQKIKEWLNIRPDCGLDALFVTYNKANSEYTPLSGRMLQRKIKRTAKKLGLIKKNGLNTYHIKLHEVRDTFKSLCTKSDVNETASEFFMGHQVDALGYNKAYEDIDWTRAEYSKVEPKLNIISNPEGRTTLTDRKEMIMNFAKSMGVEITDMKIAKMREQYPDKEDDELIGQIVRAELRGGETQEEEFTQVDENELVHYLKDGWKIVQQLNGSNQFIIKK